MRSDLVFFLAAAAVVGAAGVEELPIYCRLLQKGLETATFNPIVDDVNMSTTTDVPVLGPVVVSASHLQIASVKLVGCGASVNQNGRFNIGITQLDIELGELAWNYRQEGFPHTYDYGVAKGKTSISFNVTVNTDSEHEHLFKLQIGEIDIALNAQHHTWLTPALVKLTKFMRPLISIAVQHEAEKTLDASLAEIKAHGGCAFLGDVLKGFDMTKLSFDTYQPIIEHVPLIGNVSFNVKTSYVNQPKTMDCKSLGFSGSVMTADIQNVPFSAGFQWSYQKPGSSFWHNKGTGMTDIVAGTALKIDFLNPTNTKLVVSLPKLKLTLTADSDKWMYDAMTDVMTPLLRESLSLFGGKVLTHFIEKCLEDPTCPHVHPQSIRTANNLLIV